ncbi:winged helix-turn-helix transcriptional regulator [Streptomyces sp. NPDC059629]|uniref:winged helix-turn-helix transcriptional regulator n=1 Tax=Streptomyces sp. NPDC059629 TaxID=3346889 RepID=UPI0036B88A3E
MVIRCLEGGPCRFGELRVPLGPITPKVLSETLCAMERDGLVTCTAYDENPPRVEYALTPLGRTLIPLLDAARSWSETRLPALLAARHAGRRRRRGPAPEPPGRARAVDPAS